MITPADRAQELADDYREEILSGNSPNMVKMLTAAIDDFRIRQDIKVCDDHKRYKGKRKPRTGCVDCWRIYIENLTS